MTAPAIPREQWASHPNYPAHLLLVGSHQNFVRISNHLIDQARDKTRLDYITSLYFRWIGAMRSHEAYEERTLYPFLTRRWDASFEQACEGHAQLHNRDRAVRSAVQHHTQHKGGALVMLRAALAAHHSTLRNHLKLEEDLVIPLLLALSPQEFRDFAG